MSMNFPNSPTNNQSYTSAGKTYTYNSSKTVWTVNQTLDYDSATVINLIDSAYLQARTAAGTDSSQVISLVSTNSNKVFTVADMTALGALSGMTTGDQALVTGTSKLFMYNGTGWYLIATIANESPSAITGVDSSYTLATDGTAIVINAIATDPEGLPLTWSSSTSGLGTSATIAQGTGDSSNYFTVTPSTNDSDAGTFTLTIAATDNVNGAVNFPIGFTLSFPLNWSNLTQTTVLAYSAYKGASGYPYGTDYFGISVGVDNNYAIVGASGVDASTEGGNSGAAYIFYKSNGAWSQQQQLLFGSNFANGYMGRSVSIGGTTEGSVAVVGANALLKAIWYNRSGTTWSKVATVTGPANSGFGYKVRISGDTTAVGALTDTTAGTNKGRVYIYTGNGTLQTSFTPSESDLNYGFGGSLDIDGDLLAAGSINYALGGGNRGGVWIYERSGTSWTKKALLTPSDGYNNQRFGHAVSIHKGATTNTIAISCGDISTETGMVYIFTGSGTSYTQQQKIVSSDIAAADEFGIGNGQGNTGGEAITLDKSDGNTLFVGAPMDDDNSLNSSGSIYVFTRTGSTWSQQYKKHAFTAGPFFEGRFGYSIATDDSGSLIVGAPGHGSGGNNEGNAYIFNSI